MYIFNFVNEVRQKFVYVLQCPANQKSLRTTDLDTDNIIKEPPQKVEIKDCF
jgi:hypothetical protein